MGTSGSSLHTMMSRLENADALDAKAGVLDKPAQLVTGGNRQALLRGDWLGHALHPLLTDLPLGCWLSAGVLDFFGGRSSRRAAQRLVGAGLLFTPPTVASGLAEFRELAQPKTRRVAVVHAGANAVVASLYFSSWRARRRGHHVLGIALSTLGGLGACASGYLGGHLSFARGAGVEERGVIDLRSGDEFEDVRPLPRRDTTIAAAFDVPDEEEPYVVGSLDEAELERYYRTVVRLKRNNESRSIRAIMSELGETGPQAELRALDALQTLASRGRLDLVPIVAEFSGASGDEVNENNETHWYEPVE